MAGLAWRRTLRILLARSEYPGRTCRRGVVVGGTIGRVSAGWMSMD